MMTLFGASMGREAINASLNRINEHANNLPMSKKFNIFWHRCRVAFMATHNLDVRLSHALRCYLDKSHELHDINSANRTVKIDPKTKPTGI